MKVRTKKKAFTIVELVVVIAVIAVLAAVLIPTFSNVIKKANQSADIQACREMNTYLAVNEVTEGSSIFDVYDVLEEGGMSAKNYKPLTNDRYYFWDSKLNRIVYTEKNGTVIYPEEYAKETSANGWYSLSGQIDTSNAQIHIPSSAPAAGGETTLTVGSAADFVKAAQYLRNNQNIISGYTSSSPATVTIALSNDVDLMGADISFLEKAASKGLDVVIDGGNNTLKGLYISDKHATVGSSGDGVVSNTYGAAMFNHIKTLTVKDITIDSCYAGSTSISQGSIFAGQVSGAVTYQNVTVKNSTVQGKNKSGLLAGYVHGKVTLNNVTVQDNTVIAGVGECGVLFGVVTYKETDSKPFTVSGLTMSDNTIKFGKSAKTFKYTGETFTGNGITYNTLPLNGEFGYEGESITEGRLGLAGVCFLGIYDNFIMHNTNIKDEINGVQVRMACALNDPTLVTSEFTISSLYTKQS